MIARARLPLLCSALLAAACAGEATYSEPPPASPTYVQGATVAAPADDQASAEIVYVDEPPVVDVETYPSVEYEGTTVYFVGGYWYRHGPHGWGYLRSEPPTLARARVEHQADARWTRAQQAPAPRPARPPEARTPEARTPEPPREPPREIPREPSREAQPTEGRTMREQARPEPVAPRPEELRPSEERAPEAKPADADKKKPGEEDENAPPPAPKKRPVKRAPPPAHPEPDRR
jgi:hypothetical protein